ncbi:iron-sulfur cluster biosynthesis family protein [Periweissella cryptocerci]|uniref:Iron-sulfur cluster biosynthesis family protein n=1 Tax=Periweissella cryptocerci TaxID=2506420 RepID=A0A4V1AIV3_9LACO|nr:iron-sulfur cluster biosynthesis family protein [Periweissella cryptocerci]QBO36805.1 iron-sulfur cluster biosynthesis family protein [Periweissella cryptocerci]
MFTLNFDDNAVARLEKYFNDDYTVLMDFDDGVGPFTEHGASCTLDVAFRIIIVAKDTDIKDYQQVINTNLGPMLGKEYANYALNDVMKITLQPTFNRWELKGESETIDPALQIVTKYVA